MKEITFPARVFTFASHFVDVLLREQNAELKVHPGENTNGPRKLERKDFTYYMQVIDHETQKPVGHLTDISPQGFKLDCVNPLPAGKDFRLCIDLTSEVADKPLIIFIARSKWCQVDRFDPFCYNVGFQLIDISPEDNDIFKHMAEKYGKIHEDKFIDLRRSNIW